MVLVGNSGEMPDSHCGIDSQSGGLPITKVEATPVIVEKPYIVFENDKYFLKVPHVERNKVGTTPGFDNAEAVSFEKVYVASDEDSAEKINAKLAEGNHLVLQPGKYHLEDSIHVTRDDTVVMGLGLATLIPTSGKPALKVDNVNGVKVSGLLLQAHTTHTETLL